MGQTLQVLSEKKLTGNPIFPNRFVVEVCEAIHFHYKNLRLLLSKKDWIELAEGVSDALKRYRSRQEPDPKQGTHIELCRKQMSDETENTIKINLNKNLYLANEGKIFAEGSEFTDQNYIHLKLGRVRLEFSLGDFNELADAVLEAKEKLCALQS